MNLIHWLKNDKKASPLIEEALLVALGLICILLILGVISGIFDWIFEIL
ncbi:MAG: hypothetical protein ACFFCZ_02555 [Promethearchaeota archaeon]